MALPVSKRWLEGERGWQKARGAGGFGDSQAQPDDDRCHSHGPGTAGTEHRSYGAAEELVEQVDRLTACKGMPMRGLSPTLADTQCRRANQEEEMTVMHAADLSHTSPHLVEARIFGFSSSPATRKASPCTRRGLNPVVLLHERLQNALKRSSQGVSAISPLHTAQPSPADTSLEDLMNHYVQQDVHGQGAQQGFLSHLPDICSSATTQDEAAKRMRSERNEAEKQLNIQRAAYARLLLINDQLRQKVFAANQKAAAAEAVAADRYALGVQVEALSGALEESQRDLADSRRIIIEQDSCLSAAQGVAVDAGREILQLKADVAKQVEMVSEQQTLSSRLKKELDSSAAELRELTLLSAKEMTDEHVSNQLQIMQLKASRHELIADLQSCRVHEQEALKLRRLLAHAQHDIKLLTAEVETLTGKANRLQVELTDCQAAAAADNLKRLASEVRGAPRDCLQCGEVGAQVDLDLDSHRGSNGRLIPPDDADLSESPKEALLCESTTSPRAPPVFAASSPRVDAGEVQQAQGAEQQPRMISVQTPELAFATAVASASPLQILFSAFGATSQHDAEERRHSQIAHAAAALGHMPSAQPWHRPRPPCHLFNERLDNYVSADHRAHAEAQAMGYRSVNREWHRPGAAHDSSASSHHVLVRERCPPAGSARKEGGREEEKSGGALTQDSEDEFYTPPHSPRSQ